MSTKVEIVMPVHNRRELTLQCLRSLAEIDRTGLDIHIIVVDASSSDGTGKAVRENFPAVEIVTVSDEVWYSGGTNRGLEAALEYEPDYILCCNDDSVFDDQTIKCMLETAGRNRRSVVGAVLVNWSDRRSIFQVAPKWNLWWGGMRHWVKQTVHTLPRSPWKVELIVGNCVLFPAAAIREVGFMDEKRLPQYGDAEYTPRMRKAGWTLLIDPRALVYCKPNDVPERIRELSGKAALSKMLGNPHHPHSLKRRVNATVGSAPNKLTGYLAILVFFIRVLLGRNVEGRWALTQDEPPLSEIYKDETIGNEDSQPRLRRRNALR